jgi:hypothetical protein
MMSPADHPAIVRKLHGITAVDAAHRALFYGHYLRALIIQGSEGFGALGEGTEILKKRFLPDPGLVLDSARAHHLSWHNMRHASRQGSLVLAFERESGLRDEVAAVTPLDGEASSELVRILLSDAPAEELAARTGPDCVVRLLRTSRPYRGRSEVCKAINQIRQWRQQCAGDLHVGFVGPTWCEVSYAFTSKAGETVKGRVAVTGARGEDGTIARIDVAMVRA